MKTFVRFAGSVLFTATLMLVASAAMYAVEPAPPLTKPEVKQLIQTANTPEDHRKLAAYYHWEAQRLQEEASDHTEMGAEYAKNPSSHPVPKYPTMGQHCRDLAGYFRQASKKAAQLAAMHDQLAK